jgi:hypothetical protein
VVAGPSGGELSVGGRGDRGRYAWFSGDYRVSAATGCEAVVTGAAAVRGARRSITRIAGAEAVTHTGPPGSNGTIQASPPRMTPDEAGEPEAADIPER